jgi:hypothetical protein
MLLTTNLRWRFNLLEIAANSIDAYHSHLFDQKVMTVDCFEKGEFLDSPDIAPDCWFDRFRVRGWEVVAGKCCGQAGMANNVRRGLKKVKNPYLFYMEDDIFIDSVPDNIDGIFRHPDLSIGYICYNTHVYDIGAETDESKLVGLAPEKFRFINNEDNYYDFDGTHLLIKGPIIRDQYYLNCPVTITHTELMGELVRYAMKNCTGLGWEPGLTKSWFDHGYDKNWEVAIYVQPDTVDSLPISFLGLHKKAQMQFWNNNVKYRHGSINDRQNTIF